MGAVRDKAREMGRGYLQKALLCHHKVSELCSESYGKPLHDFKHRLKKTPKTKNKKTTTKTHKLLYIKKQTKQNKQNPINTD